MLYYLERRTTPQEPAHFCTMELLEWLMRSFNYLFLVVYPPEREAEVPAALGNRSDPHGPSATLPRTGGSRYSDAERDLTCSLPGSTKAPAWRKRQITPARAAAHDQAFLIYAGLTQDKQQPASLPAWCGHLRPARNLGHISTPGGIRMSSISPTSRSPRPRVGPGPSKKACTARRMAYYALGANRPRRQGHARSRPPEPQLRAGHSTA